ncbi:ethylbenzene dehydrogenase-related protein [Halomicrobium salinisoli]|uniref:ethylbenzene dehydrogenase-related protein n=1 Tax=Halomicrobium salinisoli TaxID=2878391 RepID=UPI001CEFBE87|nr:ethylbenzene dehydrogenase-related protein [Halomicrobium salinisoli]
MLDLDRGAARRATAAAAVVAALLVVAQGAVTAAVTGGQQPMVETDRVPQVAADGQWADAPSRSVSLSEQQMALPYGGGSVDEMEVQAMTNDSHVAFRLSWEDPTNDTSLSSPGSYSDAAAVMLHSGERPPITMGATGEPVNIWYWRAQWQYGADDRSEWTGDMYAYPHPSEETKPGLAAGNPLSQGEYDDYGQNYYAAGFGSLSHAPAQNVDARATRDGDEWSVAFVREHATNGTHDAAFRANESMYLSFAVWNGSADEVNGKKSLTMQFSTLDTESGELAAADAGGDGGDGSGESGGDGNSGDGGSGLPQPFGYVGGLVAVVIVSWAAVYWRAAR